jgi:hypothetical protein
VKYFSGTGTYSKTIDAPAEWFKAGAALKPGANTLQIKVANRWVNRLVGDQQPDATRT